MTRRFGIDTSILMRLLTGLPHEGFEHCVNELTMLIEEGGEVFASNQVLGEAYVTVQHHYGMTKCDAKSAILTVLQSGIVAPLNGSSAIQALEATGGSGLLDRLIVDDYSRSDLETLTLDRKMATLQDARRI